MINNLINNFASEETQASGIAALGLDPKAFLIQLITFILVFYILYKLVFFRIVEVLEKRRLTIQEGVELTVEIKAEREKLEKQIAEAHKVARKDSEKLMSETQDQAALVIKDAEDLAKVKVEKMLDDAKKKIVEETERARRSLEKETVELVIRATEAVTKEKIDSKKDSELIANALKEQN